MSRYARYPSLDAKRVVITGGASGIGAAFVAAFRDQGSRVAFLDRDAASGEALAAETGAYFHAADVTDTHALRAALRASEAELGGVDVLINNAADDTRHETATLTPEEWDRCLAVNLKHQFFATQAVLPNMIKSGGGSVICVGSISWLNKTTGMVGYTTSKAALHGLVRALAREAGPHRIRINALLPGWTMTEKQQRLWVDAAAEREIAAQQCLPDRVMPEDVSRLALFLAADDSAMCTQQTFIVDGGWV